MLGTVFHATRKFILRDRLSGFFFSFFLGSTECQARLDGSLIIAHASTAHSCSCVRRCVTQAEVFNRKDCGPPDNYEASAKSIIK